MDNLAKMISMQRDFQRSLGYDFAAMSQRERIAYVKDMVQALIHEAGEALDEVSWKSWATAEFVNEDNLKTELTDIWIFLMNLWLVACPGDTPEEIADVFGVNFSAKFFVNRRRQQQGYDGKNKCPVCRRALDDPNLGFTTPELICDGTVEGCKMQDVAPRS